MALFKRPGAKYYRYDFWLNGIRRQGSTQQTNKGKAKTAEAKIRSDLAMAAIGISPPKDSPNFKDFMEGRFRDFCATNCKAQSTAAFYRDKSKRLVEFTPFGGATLAEITVELIERYKTQRLRSVSIGAVNDELATLRRALYLAHDWGLMPKKIKVTLLPGQHRREFVLSGDLENAYLAAAPFPLREAAVLMLDAGLRPDEVVRLKKADVTAESVTVRSGKTANARRALPLTERAKESVRLLVAVRPDTEWLFPGRKGHLRAKSLANMHAALWRLHDWPQEFILYSLRHSFGTRLAESGASVFDIKRLMGHFSIRVSERYIHPSADGLALAMARKAALDRILRGEHQDATPIRD